MKHYKVISKYLLPIFEAKSENNAEWFGYYNYDPLNYDQTRLLCNRGKTERWIIEESDSIELGYYDIKTGIWHHIGDTNSWNWQQGAMMQWVPDSHSKVIFNCTTNGHICSKIIDINDGAVRELDSAIYGLTPDGKRSITVDMERAYWCRAYHYQSVVNNNKDGRVLEGDGIFELDLETNRKRLLISIEDVIKADYRPYFEKQKHWLEHIMVSPKGDKFCFLHRFSPESNVFSYETRLIIANIDGSAMQVIPGWDKYVWSHFGWRSDNSFSIYCYAYPRPKKEGDLSEVNNTPIQSKSFRKLMLSKLRPVIKSIMPAGLIRKLRGPMQYYQYYEVNSDGQFALVNRFDNKHFDIDGHPSFTKDGCYMITDTYPDKRSWRHLFILNVKNGKSIRVAKFKENNHKNCAMCDLHPKLSVNNDFVMVDSTYTGRHSLSLFKINWNLVSEVFR